MLNIKATEATCNIKAAKATEAARNIIAAKATESACNTKFETAKEVETSG